jgi:voltage-gated potassium channel Kch
MLRADNELNTPQGERAFSILLFQDLSIIPLITIIAAMGPVKPDAGAPSGWTMALYTLIAIVGLVAAGRLLLNPLFRLIGRFGERELFVVAGLFTVVGAAAVMHAFHLSVALGAFIAGVVLAESPYRHELESDVEPFRSILLGLFFLSVGMILDLRLIAARPLFVIGVAAGVIVTKTLLISLLSRLYKGSWPRSIRLGLLLSQAGEFGFVLFAQAAAARLITPAAASLFSAVVTLSMATTPFLMRLTDWLERREERGGEGLDGPDKSPETSAIVVGYGRFGQTVAQMLMAKSVSVTIIDVDAEQIEVSGTFGTKVYYGDGLRLDLLRTAGAETAKIIAFCNDNETGEMTRDSLQAVLKAFPQASVLVRAYDRRQLVEFDGLDLAFAQRELFESAIVMGRAALREAGVEPAEIERVEKSYRRRDCERLERQSESGDLRAGWENSFSPDRPLPEPEVRDPA